MAGRYFLCIFIVALATLAAQIVFSRFFSVTFYYHMAFAGITIAMLGLTAGALRVYLQPQIFSAGNAPQALGHCSFSFAWSLAAAAFLHTAGVGFLFAMYAEALNFLAYAALALSMCLLLYAFIQSGTIIALLLTRFPEHAGRLYAFDLLGAALGCVGVIIALKITDPVCSVFILSLMLCGIAWQMLPASAEEQLRTRIKIAVLVLAIATTVQMITVYQGTPLIRQSWAKGNVYPTAPLFERWNTYSRVTVRDYLNPTPFGWGFGHSPENFDDVEQKFLTIDADAGTVLTKFDGNPESIRYLKNDIINLPYYVRDVKRSAVIGIGGGRDILSALAFGVDHVTGIELNPAIMEALNGRFGAFTGHLDQRPDVRMVTAEARSYLSSQPDKYDLIQISLIDTWAMTAAGGLTLSENKLYTTNAWEDFLDRLDTHGMLAVSRWYNEEEYPGEFYRLLAITGTVLADRYPGEDPRSRLLVAISQPHETKFQVITLIISQSPFSVADLQRFTEASSQNNFIPILKPGMRYNAESDMLASGKADKAFFDALPVDVTPVSDDRPFFFYFSRFENLFSPTSSLKGVFSVHLTKGMSVLAGLFLFTLVASILFIAFPMARIYRRNRDQLLHTIPYTLYFGCIGLGFMFIEVSQMQRLIIFLGHPVYGLSVVLFVLLLASGAGSYLQQTAALRKLPLWYPPVILCVILLATGIATPLLTEILKYHDNFMRILISGLLIAPMGIGMGMMFPIGVELVLKRHKDLLPWYWGINGAMSVFASVAAVAVSLQWGISNAFWVGAGFYGVSAFIAMRQKTQEGTVSAALAT